VLDRLRPSRELTDDFAVLAGLGGRLVGSESERRACRWLRERLRAIDGARIDEHRFDYTGWQSTRSSLELIDGSTRELPCHPLVWSGETPADGLEAEVVDLGRGAPEDFERAAALLPGRIALVEHEYPFARQTIHRRVKYASSLRHNAAGFLIANNLPGKLLVTGSCGQDAPENIPAFGVSRETAALLRSRSCRVRMRHRNARDPREGVNLIAEIPGRAPEWVVVCAHYDGHDLAESALDNATGVACALELARALAPSMAERPRGLRVILFTAEESGLLGSRRYVASLSEADRRRISVVLNLDTLTGSPRLWGLVSDFAELEALVTGVAGRLGVEMASFAPLLRNSDHFNFAEQGIPALRLVAGFDEPHAGARFLLTSGDTRDKVPEAELEHAARVTRELAAAALNWPGIIAPHRRPGVT